MRPLPVFLLLLALLSATAVDAQRPPAKRTARDAAATFTLDPATLASEAGTQDQVVTAPDAPSRPASPAASDPASPAAAMPDAAIASSPAVAPASGGGTTSIVSTAVDSAAPTGAVTLFTLDTPIATLIADPGAKGVLDRDLPGLSSDEHLDKFRGLSLRQFQPLTGGQLTVSLMAKVASDLAGLAGSAGAALPAPVAGRKTRRDETGR